VCDKELFFFNSFNIFNFILPDEAETGAAEEQPVRNNPVADEVIRFIRGWEFCSRPFLL
jgi:hypothetical protein